MLEILKNKKLYINIGILFSIGVLFLIAIVYSLNSFTRHGETITVPDFTGYYYQELEGQPEFAKFKFTIIDSIYDSSKEKGSIVSQDPNADSKVKNGRHIYLTVVAMNPETIDMPNLVDLSLRNASSIIETYGLIINKLSYVPDIAKNAVVEQKYRGENIEEGTPIIKGSGIELVLGLGTENNYIKVPLLIGLTRKQAIDELHLASLNLGNEHFDQGDDTTTVRIYRQSPNYGKEQTVKMGEIIELWYKSEDNFDFDQYLKTIKSSDKSTDSLSNSAY